MRGIGCRRFAVAKLRGPKRPSLTIPQAAEYTGLSVRQIKRMIGERALPYWKTAASQQGHVLRQGAGE
jgi:excisionase family DNA binding protein